MKCLHRPSPVEGREGLQDPETDVNANSTSALALLSFPGILFGDIFLSLQGEGM